LAIFDQYLAISQKWLVAATPDVHSLIRAV